jgi:hypothetical protein
LRYIRTIFEKYAGSEEHVSPPVKGNPDTRSGFHRNLGGSVFVYACLVVFLPARKPTTTNPAQMRMKRIIGKIIGGYLLSRSQP